MSGFTNEINVETLNTNISLNNINDHVVTNSENGDIEVIFITLNQENPTSITSINGIIDISIPSNTSANLIFKT